jgi:hypothetical protein
MPNSFVHTELNTTDPKQAREFFAKLFDWTLEDMDMGPGGTYTLIKAGEGMGSGGGIMQHPMPGAPSVWVPYVLVDDLMVSTEKARSLGAQIIKENVPVPNMGTFSIIADPTGAVLGLWQTKAK